MTSFNTSGDLLNYVLAFAVIWVVILISWLLWYAISVVRTIKNAVDEVTERVRMVDEVFHLIREKLESTSTYLGLLVEIIKDGFVWFRERDRGTSFSDTVIHGEATQKSSKNRKK